MARTKQTARKTVSQKVPRKQFTQSQMKKKAKKTSIVEDKTKSRRFKPGTVALR